MAFIPGQLTQLTAAHELYLYSWVYLSTWLQYSSNTIFKGVQAAWGPEINILIWLHILGPYTRAEAWRCVFILLFSKCNDGDVISRDTLAFTHKMFLCGKALVTPIGQCNEEDYTVNCLNFLMSPHQKCRIRITSVKEGTF